MVAIKARRGSDACDVQVYLRFFDFLADYTHLLLMPTRWTMRRVYFTFGVRGDVAPLPSPSLDATLSVPEGVSGTSVGVEGAERALGTGDMGGGIGDLGAEPGIGGNAIGLTLIPYFRSSRGRR